MTVNADDFEKLGVFYLGRKYDLPSKQVLDDLCLYDSRDLCTHAMCVGMTGSGKTGLCLSLLEEAAIDGIPAICVDPKGDLANLKLAFPDMKPDDFRPWLQQGDATRKGMTLDELASSTAKTWKQGLASWGQTPARVAKFKQAVDVAIYTPGSNAGLPLTVLKSFDAPPQALLDDSDAMRQRVTGATSGLLTLLGIDGDPLLSAEHILVSSILNHCWRAGRNVSIGDLIGLIQSPPIERVGVLDLETFMPTSDRAKLAMRLNNLLASPAFSTWLDGEPLSIDNLLYTSAGKPRLSILSIAHLSDTERMFFVTILLNELLAWMRTQSGTSSLRAMFYMDEVYGYFPPSAKPPSKEPMLTLLKQARAFGLGITLATQNPVDLDYKGLSNIGTWFLGRLQTERDKARVLDGLEGAATQTGQAFDKAHMEQLLASLGNRVFLMNNVHDDQPTIFQTRWAMSYLAGPLGRKQITALTDQRPSSGPSPRPAAQRASKQSAGHARQDATVPTRPIVPAGVEERFMVPSQVVGDGKLVYRPAVYGKGSLHFVRASADVDQWEDHARIVHCGIRVPDAIWKSSEPIKQTVELLDQPDQRFNFYDLPTKLRSSANFKDWSKQLKEYFYRHHGKVLYKSPRLSEYAPVDTTEAEARIAFTHAAREARDVAMEKLRGRYAKKVSSLQKKIRTAADRVDREKGQAKQAMMSTIIQFGASLLSAFTGNKLASRTNIGRTASAMRGAGRVTKERADATRAKEVLEQLQEDMETLEASLRDELEQLSEVFDVEHLELEALSLSPRKGDLKTYPAMLVWTPWKIDAHGAAEPLFSTLEGT